MGEDGISKALEEILPRIRWWPWRGVRKEIRVEVLEESEHGILVFFSADNYVFQLPLAPIDNVPEKLADRVIKYRGKYWVEAEYTTKYLELMDSIDGVKAEDFAVIEGKVIEAEPVDLETTTNAVARYKLSSGLELVVKSYRILPELGIEPLMLTKLVRENFAFIPKLYRVYSYVLKGKKLYLSLVTQRAGRGEDGGAPFVERLKGYFSDLSKGVKRGIQYSLLLKHALKLGGIIADMHVKLNPGESTGFFGLEPITESDISAWHRRIERRIRVINERLDELIAKSKGHIRNAYEYWQSFFNGRARREAVERAIADLDLFVDTYKGRTHQDLHLKQMVYVQESGSFIITDFEGEPLRTDEERYMKEPLVRDLATMATSYYYLVFDVYKNIVGKPLYSIAHKIVKQKFPFIWEWASRHTLYTVLKYSYLTSPQKLGYDLFGYKDKPLTKFYFLYVPVWIVERALYEIEYELHYRPEWFVVPLSCLVHLPIPFYPRK